MLDKYFKEKKNDGIIMPKEFSQGQLHNIKYQEDAILKGTFFDDSEYDDTTIWPDNFKPERRKAIKKPCSG